MPIVSHCWASNVLQTHNIWVKIVGVIFEKIEIFNFSFCELPLILEVAENQIIARDVCKKTLLYVEFERDLSIGLGATFGNG